MNFNDNVDLTDPILSRFDLLAVVKDDINEDYDDALATFVLNSHMKNHPEVLKQKSRLEQEEEPERVQHFEAEFEKEKLLPNNVLA